MNSPLSINKNFSKVSLLSQEKHPVGCSKPANSKKMKTKEPTENPSAKTLWGRVLACSNILGTASLAVLALAAGAGSLCAADLTWNNGASTGNWNLTDANWSGSVWNNATPDNALFNTVGGAINLTVPIIAGNVSVGSNTANPPLTTLNGGSL